ncbi:Adenosine 3'-phospho 5'-phosphosulfate transporter 2 [Tupaia chinensis]|uniref:Adenosine 3'-phospho 5'-phosphosulfate transporter 2 n=1 Tax=Tupaia chinensis TaxID=246437 RepID=L9L9G2_TUPCH|nr:Adenosine 3'-phospho 5'-phosphosulfate transporter 2 [Tupaia chinensis]
MTPPPKEIEGGSMDEEMSEDQEDDSSGEEVVFSIIEKTRRLPQLQQKRCDLVQQTKERLNGREESNKDNFENTECSNKRTMDLKFNSSRKYVSISVPSKTQTMSPHIKSVDDIVVLGINLSKFNKLTQFFICVAGVFVFYLIYGYLQELIFSVEGLKSYGWYLTLVQFAFYSIFGMIELQLIQDKRRRIPGKTYMIIAFLTVGTMGLSNTSLGYLNYPTQVIFKCCKLIPVMLGGVFIQGKRYNVADVSAAVCMSLGLIWFTLADSTIAPNFNLTGVMLISLALCADAVIGNVQEKAMKLHNASNSEMNPIRTYGYAFLFSLTGYFGISFVLALIKIFGALLAVTVTTGRKAMTIVLSFIFFAKPFTFQPAERNIRRKTRGPCRCGEFSKKCSERWETMSGEERPKSDEMAKVDKARCDREMKDEGPAQGGTKRKDPSAPQKATI